jgi:hypothetical protein
MMHVFDHAPYTKKQIVEPIIASHTTNIMPTSNCRSVRPQNRPTPHEHVVQGPHAILGVILHTLTHLSTHVIKNYLPIKTFLPYGQFDPVPWVLIPLKLYMPVDTP